MFGLLFALEVYVENMTTQIKFPEKKYLRARIFLCSIFEQKKHDCVSFGGYFQRAR